LLSPGEFPCNCFSFSILAICFRFQSFDDLFSFIFP
jgi:hypothetical protein